MGARANLPTLLLFFTTFSLVFGLYWLTLAPGVVGGDSGEHQLAVPLLGIPHTTGYPLYILSGKIWTLLIPVGSLAWRVNLFSAFGGALAAGVTTLATYHLSEIVFRRSSLWAGALVAGLALSFGMTLWQWSVIAGVRSFNVFFFALLTLLAIRLAQHYQAGNQAAANRTLQWLALTVGLSLAHHRTTIFYLPSLVGWIWWHDRQLLRQPRRLLRLALLALAPLSLYAFIYWRGLNNPPYSHEKITDLRSLWFLVGSGDSTGLFLTIDPAYLPARLAFIWHDLLTQLSRPGVALAAVGGLLLLWRRPAYWLVQSLLVLILVIFVLDFEVVNLNEAPTWYLMPAYFILAMWLGLGVNATALVLTDTIRRTALPSSIYSLPFSFFKAEFFHSLLITIAFTVLLAYALAWPTWQQQVQAATAPLDDWRQLLRGRQGERLVESSLPEVEPNSIIWSDWEQYTPYKYYQLIEGWRLDVTIRNPLDRWPEKVAAAREAGRPVYFTRKPADLLGAPLLSMLGPLIQLRTEPNLVPPADLVRLDANFEGELELLGYQASVQPQFGLRGRPANPILQLRLYWRAPKKIEWDYALSLRLIDAHGQEIYKQDAAHPVLSSYPTSLWTPGEVVGDYYELPLRAEAGSLRLQILPYRTEAPGVWHNLTLNGPNLPAEGILIGPF
jgi:hypothetical protein